MTDAAFELYYWNTPNGLKAVIALEEIAVPYTHHLIDLSHGEQHNPAFRQLSPDGKIPALVDISRDKLTLFESGAILLYLAGHYPQINGQTEAERGQVLSWTLWQVGQLGPLAGQFGRFKGLTPPNPVGINHFEQLVWRCLDVLEKRLQESEYIVGEHYTVADIASFPWVASDQSYLQRYQINWRDKCPAVNRWAKLIAQRPAVEKSLNIDDES